MDDTDYEIVHVVVVLLQDQLNEEEIMDHCMKDYSLIYIPTLVINVLYYVVRVGTSLDRNNS